MSDWLTSQNPPIFNPIPQHPALHHFSINVTDTGYYVCLHNIIGIEQQILVKCIHTLILTRSNNLYIYGFSNNDINYIVDYIAINQCNFMFIY